MGLQIFFLIIGLTALGLGAEMLVRGGGSFARHLGLSPLVIGLTVVAFGTSAPEMIVSVGGSARGMDDIALGNVIGSNIFNVGFILGICAVVRPMNIQLSILKADIPVLVAVTLLTTGLFFLGDFSRLLGAVFLMLLIAYTALSIRAARREVKKAVAEEFEIEVPNATRSIGVDILWICGGLIALMVGSQWLLSASVAIAKAFGISDALISLTIVSAGTSMPELATSLLAALRKHSDIAVGNVVGSNIFNLLGILGLSSLVNPIRPEGIQAGDVWMMAGVAVAMVPLLWTSRRLQRWEGGLLVLLYVGYVVFRWP